MSARVETSEKSNVFAEVGLPAEYLAKAEILVGIDDAIKRKEMTQAAAAAVLGIDQPRVSALLRGRLDLFSLERLLSFVQKLGNSVEISIRPSETPTISVRRQTAVEIPMQCEATAAQLTVSASRYTPATGKALPSGSLGKANNQKKQRLNRV